MLSPTVKLVVDRIRHIEQDALKATIPTGLKGTVKQITEEANLQNIWVE
jgi:hypothetical protein